MTREPEPDTSERRRRRRHDVRWLLSAAASAPRRAVDALPRWKRAAKAAEDGSGRLRRRHGLGRKTRIALGVTAAVVVAAGAVGGVRYLRSRDPRSESWRLHDEAVQHFRAGRFAEAAATSRAILSRNPRDAVARYNLGASLLGLADEAGWAEITAAAAAAPDLDDAHLALARRALAAGRDDTALTELRLVVEHPPEPPAAHALLADVLRRRGAYSEAMRHLRRVLEDKAADTMLRIETGGELGRLHGLRAAFHRTPDREKRLELECYNFTRQLADAALERPSGYSADEVASLHLARARAQLALDKTSEALADVDLALRAGPGPELQSSARLLRAQIYGLTGDADAAESEMTAALSADSKPPADSFLGAAAYYMAHDQRAQALELLARAAEAHPADVELGAEYAYLLFFSDRADAAEAECERLLRADPSAWRPLVVRGDLRRARGDLAGARRAYEEAAARAPGDAMVKLRVAGTAFSESGRAGPDADARLEEAGRIARQVLARTPDDPAALVALAKTVLARATPVDTEDAEEAHGLLARAVDADPLSLEAHTLLAWADLRRGRYDEAVFGFERVLAAAREERPELRLLLAQAYLGTGAADRAADATRRALRGLGDEPSALELLVEATIAQRDLDGALDALRRLEVLEPGRIEHLLRQAMVLAQQGEIAAAEERFAAADAVAAALPDAGAAAAGQMRVAESRAEFYRRAGDLQRARDSFGAALERNPADTGAAVRYGRFLAALGQTDDAERQFQRVLATRPADVEARRALCDLWFARGEATPALVNQVREVAELAPEDPVVDYLRGKLAVLQGDFRIARELLTRYAKVRADDPDAHFALGVALARGGDPAAAVTHLERAASLVPESLEVRAALAKTRSSHALDLLRRGRHLEAQAALRRATGDDPDAMVPRAMLAESLRMTGDVDLSEKEIRALLHREPTDPTALRLLAAVEYARGRTADAARTLQALADVTPEDWTAWAFLSEARATAADLDGAELAAQRAREAAPGEPRALAPLLHVLVLRGDFAAAEREIESAAAGDPTEAQFPYFLAILRSLQGRPSDVVSAAARALDAQPSMSDAVQLAVHALREGMGDPARARAFAKERAAGAPDSGAIAYLHGWLEAQAGDGAAALGALRAHTQADAPFLPAVALAAVLLMDQGDPPAAREVLRRGLESNPEAAELHYLLAQSYLAEPGAVQGGEVQEPSRGLAVAALRTSCSLAQGHAPSLNNLAYLLADDETTRGEALELAEAAVRIRPTYAPYLDTCGVVLVRLGRHEPAAELFRRALGALEEERAELDRSAALPTARAEPRRIDRLRRRLDATTAEVRAHYDAALREAGGR